MDLTIGGYILPQIIYMVLVGILCLTILITTVRGLTLGGNKRSSSVMDTVQVTCLSCQWEGEVPRLRKRCPMCGGDAFIE